MTTSSHYAGIGIGVESQGADPAGRVGLSKRAEIGGHRQRVGFWQAVWDWIAPLGYENAAGFHYGVPTPERAHLELTKD